MLARNRFSVNNIDTKYQKAQLI